MPIWLLPAMTSLASILASSGFWAYVKYKDHSKNAMTQLIMGIGYDKVTTKGLAFIERGWITRDEFDEYQKYLVKPYLALGGNGVAQRISEDVGRLPFHSHSRYELLFRDKEDERYTANVPVVTHAHQGHNASE